MAMRKTAILAAAMLLLLSAACSNDSTTKTVEAPAPDPAPEQGVAETPAIENLKVFPTIAAYDAPTAITASVTVTGDLDGNTVDLVQIDADGTSTVIGALAPAGDGATYTISAEVRLVTKAEYRVQIGELAKSASRAVTVLAGADPVASSADTDKNGVRDDIQRNIGEEPLQTVRAALQQVAVAYQDALVAASDEDKLAVSERQLRAAECLSYVLKSSTDAEAAVDKLIENALGAEDRATLEQFNRFYGGRVWKQIPATEAQCDFTPSGMEG